MTNIDDSDITGGIRGGLTARMGFPDGLMVRNPLLHDLVTEQQCKILTTGKTEWRGVYENSEELQLIFFCKTAAFSNILANRKRMKY